jgi:hypothetical protein
MFPVMASFESFSSKMARCGDKHQGTSWLPRKKKSNRGFESQDCFFGIRVIIVFVLVAFFARIALNMWQYVAQSYILS